jgi:DNA-binding NarL/FixJ family response regulator
MFQKILIAEDMDFINSGIKTELSKLNIEKVDSVQYCDEALLKLKRAKLDGSPYELVISDLSFDKDFREQKITSGIELVKNIREEFPTVKIIVFSVEDKPYKVQTLFNTYNINGYVWKSRDGLRELKSAIQEIYDKDLTYISPNLASSINKNETVEISDYDILLLKLLSKGYQQDKMSSVLKELDVSPCSISAIEKRLKILKEQFNANNPAHLVAIAKDLGLI